jgi:hypothetical protein
MGPVRSPHVLALNDSLLLHDLIASPPPTHEFVPFSWTNHHSWERIACCLQQQNISISFIMDNDIVKNHMAESSSFEANDNFEMRNISQLGGTNNDEHDMRMLGRTQVLNVRELRKMEVMRAAY